MGFSLFCFGRALCTTIILISLLHTKVSSGQDTTWDALEVKWGPKPAPGFFMPLPRTRRDAKRQGFVKINNCRTKAKWRGSRYVKNDEPAITLLYDIKGVIAGIQTRFPRKLLRPFPRMKLNPAFVKDGPYFAVTAYFVNPALICKEGRSKKKLSSQGTGTNLYLQNGTSAEHNSILIPRLESEVCKTKWTKGHCFPTMGVHYWYNPEESMDCQSIFPVFLLYNKGQLNGFGWALLMDPPSSLYEHPTTAVASKFLNPVPKCLASFKTVATMHIYLTHDLKTRQC